MFYLDSSNNRYRLGLPFSYNGVTYGSGSATHEKFTALGFTPVTVAERPDDRFYVVVGPANDGTYQATERDLAELKTRFILETKSIANELLKKTDWYILRFIEEGFSDPDSQIPADIRTYRSGIRTASDARCDQINLQVTVPLLEILITTGDGRPGGLTAYPTLANATSYFTY